MFVEKIEFPKFTGVRCLMMPYIQGDPSSVPIEYEEYFDIIRSVFIKKDDVGFLTIDESMVKKGGIQRGDRARTDRALHTEAGRRPNAMYGWGGWGSSEDVILDKDVEVLLANSLNDSCAIWDAVHEDTSFDGDIGHASLQYPYSEAIMMKAGDVHRIGILTPHEGLPVTRDTKRQFIRIVSSGVYGMAPYFTVNPLL